jgi:predicted DNA-binding transcriptional regulator YafY
VTRNKTARWLDLLAFFLQHRFPVTREEIYTRVEGYRADYEKDDSSGARESLRRKFERDKDELRALGIEIETVQMPDQAGDEPTAGYKLRHREFYLPYLELREGTGTAERPYQGLLRVPLAREDVALLDRATRRVADMQQTPFAEAAASARRKLAFDLPLPMATVERLLAHPLTGDAARTLEVLQRAVAEQVAVQCRYYAIGRDAEERRVIEPWGLFFGWGRWYCVAYSRERKARRVFRIDRMRDADVLTGVAARFDVPAEFSIREYVGRAPWELAESAAERVVVRFGFPESRWVLSQHVGEPVDEMLEDGGARIAFGVRDRGPFLRWLLTFRGGIVVEEPAELAAELRALRSRVAVLYGAAS